MLYEMQREVGFYVLIVEVELFHLLVQITISSPKKISLDIFQ
jgi:hypothetical protein